MKRLLLLALAGCGSGDPCDDVTGRCITLDVSSTTIERIDLLELDVLYGNRHGTSSTSDGVVDLPLSTAIALPGTGAIDVGVVAAGKLAGGVLGTGAAQLELAAGAHARLALSLAPRPGCTPDRLYCGGDMLDGDALTLYQCNATGVPHARGRCLHACSQRTPDDQCDAGNDPCFEGGYYCGGDKVAGDPQSLYRCTGGVGADRVVCSDGCIVAPAGSDDHCR